MAVDPENVKNVKKICWNSQNNDSSLHYASVINRRQSTKTLTKIIDT